MSPVGRRAGRRQALFLLYQWDLTGQPLASLYEGEPDPFASGLAEAVAARAAELDRRITATSEDWPADRLGTLEPGHLAHGSHCVQLLETACRIPPQFLDGFSIVFCRLPLYLRQPGALQA